ncbi:cytochrome P450 [Cladochytrium replicatum]|nr:cytochrome P450 [Cladochytrium replicatum]
MGVLLILITCAIAGLVAAIIGSIVVQQLTAPGKPIRLPLIGHFYLFDDVNNLHIVFAKLADKYGDILSLQVMGQAWTIISSPEAAKKTTADQRSIIYSTRPPPKFIRDFFLYDGHGNILSMPSDEQWKSYRKLIHPLLSNTAVKDYDSLLTSGVAKLVDTLKQRCNGTPFDPETAARSFPFNVMINVLFGVSRDPTDPLYIELIEIIKGVNSATMIGKVSDLVPVMRYLPLKAWDRMRAAIKRRDVWFVREMKGVKLLLQMERDPSSKLHDSGVINILIDLIFAGVDTSATTIIYFFSFMANHPKVLKCLQEEIDAKIKDGRVPSMDDEPNLPYANAVITELLRLRPPAPLALPHSVTQDDVLDGTLVQKDSYVWYNIWRIHRHPKYWTEPVEAFDPERYIRFAENEKLAAVDGKDTALLKDNPANLVQFGFGRRYCPGQYLARRELFLAITSLAYHFHIEKPAGVNWIDDSGSLGTTLKTVPFQVVLKDRKHAQ